MIDPKNVTNYNRDSWQLFQFAVFAACVAGKNADQTANKVNLLFNDKFFTSVVRIQLRKPPYSDALYERDVAAICYSLEKYKIGQYDRLGRVIFYLNQITTKLNTILFNELVNFKGIGPKTAAFFLLHSRQDADIPVIDTHICKYMASKGVEMKVTSSLKKYLHNAALVKEAIKQDFPSMTLAQADLHLWIKYSGREEA